VEEGCREDDEEEADGKDLGLESVLTQGSRKGEWRTKERAMIVLRPAAIAAPRSWSVGECFDSCARYLGLRGLRFKRRL
jgi:hypothetical protein